MGAFMLSGTLLVGRIGLSVVQRETLGVPCTWEYRHDVEVSVAA